MIARIVGRCHVGDSLGTVFAYVVSRLALGMYGYVNLSTFEKARFFVAIKEAHDANRKLYNQVQTGRF